MKVSFIFGTRPEAIKLAPLIRIMREDGDLRTHVCVTGQHESMLAQVMNAFAIEPDVNLRLMTANQSLASFSSRALSAIDQYLGSETPDLVIVQGDTSTVMCAALASFYRQIPVGHVEAGLRTGNRYSPFPEEMNRVLTTQLAELHFAPTEGARNHLIAAGVSPTKISVTGNTIVDALLMAQEMVSVNPPSIEGLNVDLGACNGRRVVLITGHRRENFGDEFEEICEAILSLSRDFSDVDFVYPVHLNPNVQEPVYRILSHRHNIHLIPPVGYLEFVALMSRSTLILTDSGGIQEEAPSLGKPVLVMRDSTERPEGIKAGVAKLVGANRDSITKAAALLLTNQREYRRMSQGSNPYGDGQASRRILEQVTRHFAAVCV
ncbi:MAG TPA: UDP-N-acetylglucosamine 2-epimerase (non-hydrolyzing) [Phycisphaerae bacterium]|nr:UDP-N-acetylglucosamine 2-epimerase (non-hydrolyzing) [Phycisphaerae bacterium]